MSDLDSRLAAFDRKLRQIEAELGGEVPAPPRSRAVERAVLPVRPDSRPPAPPQSPEPGRPPTPAEPAPKASARPAGPPHGRSGPLADVLARHRPQFREASVIAGPFTSLDELRRFKEQLTGLDGVEQAVLRGFEGANRAVFEVRLRENRADG